MTFYWTVFKNAVREFRNPPRFKLNYRERVGRFCCYVASCVRRHRDFKKGAKPRGTHRCPRRDGHPFGIAPGNWDHWERDSPRGPRTCSFCGYLHPEDALKAASDSANKIDPSTKSYKAYIHGPIERQIRGAAKVGFYHFSREQRDRWNEILNARGPADYLQPYVVDFLKQAGKL